MQQIRSRSWRRMRAVCRPKERFSTSRWNKRCGSMPGTKIGKRCWRCSFPSKKRPNAAAWRRNWSNPATSITPWRGRRREAYRFLQDIPIFEESGLIVRVPDWWKPRNPPRPIVNVRVDGRKGAKLGVDALLDFSVGVSLDGEALTEAEMQELLASVGGLVRLKGKWVEVDREKLAEALKHWKKVERGVRDDGLSFFEGMRLLAGASLERDAAADLPQASREWTGLTAGPMLEATLNRLKSPEAQLDPNPPGLRAELRPYQRSGVTWLRFLTQLGLGACLADDMGLGKTVQVIALLLGMKRERENANNPDRAPSLLVVPASLIANWKAEIERFAPSLTYAIAHPSEVPAGKKELSFADVDREDLVITTYSMLTRLDVAGQAKLEPRDSRRSPGHQERRHAPIARRQGTAAGQPHRHDGHAGREPAVGSVVAVRFPEPGPARHGEGVCEFRQEDG